MAGTLADHFLKDLEDLSNDEEEEDLQMVQTAVKKNKDDQQRELGDSESDDEDIPDAIEEYLVKKQLQKGGKGKSSTGESISKLRNNILFLTHLENLETDLVQNQQIEKFVNLSRNDQIYELIVKTNEYLRQVDPEIMNVHKYVRDLYARLFPELEQIILNPIDYARAVKIIGNHIDMNRVTDQLSWLPNTTIMSVSVAFSASTGKPLSERDLSEVNRACDEVLWLEQQAKQKMLTYLENRMHFIAPNLCAIVGSSIAAKLIASAGGIVELAKTPAGNIQVLGSQKKALLGFSTASASLHRGHLGEVDMVVNAPMKY